MAQISQTRGQIRDRVLQRIGEAESRPDTAFPPDVINNLINDSQLAIATYAPFVALRHLHRQQDSNSSIGGIASLPDDFMRERAVIVSNKMAARIPEDHERAVANDNSQVMATTDQPAYRIENDSLWVYPQEISVVRLYYIRTPIELVADDDKPSFDEVWLEPMLNYCTGNCRVREAGALEKTALIQYHDARFMVSVWQAALSFGHPEHSTRASSAVDILARMMEAQNNVRSNP